MYSVTSSSLDGPFIGRIAVLIPEIDFGLVEQVKEGVLTIYGEPDSGKLEILAVRRAQEVCVAKAIPSYTIFTDNWSAAQSDVGEAKWVERKNNHAGIFLDRIISRPRYLRQSSRKIRSRRPPDKRQEEIFQMFNADKVEFRLSESFIWREVKKKTVDDKL